MSKPVGPYTPIVRGGDLLFTAGQVGIADGAIVDGGLEPELRQVFVNLRSVLSGAGASLADVVKTTVFLADMGDYAAMNEIYMEEFGDHRPARSAVAVKELPLGARIEIEAIATVCAGGLDARPPSSGRLTRMDVGTIIFIVVLVIAMPVGVLLSMTALAGIFGGLIGRNSDLDNVDDDGEPNEYLQLSDANPYDG